MAFSPRMVSRLDNDELLDFLELWVKENNKARNSNPNRLSPVLMVDIGEGLKKEIAKRIKRGSLRRVDISNRLK